LCAIDTAEIGVGLPPVVSAPFYRSSEAGPRNEVVVRLDDLRGPFVPLAAGDDSNAAIGGIRDISLVQHVAVDDVIRAL
jgi:hypothetical protein